MANVFIVCLTSDRSKRIRDHLVTKPWYLCSYSRGIEWNMTNVFIVCLTSDRSKGIRDHVRSHGICVLILVGGERNMIPAGPRLRSVIVIRSTLANIQ
jgi:hypothetical protein